MKLGIIGKPQCGKTTVFNAAAGQHEAVGDYSQASHRAIIKVPDERVDRLAELAQPDKMTYAEIEFLDAPGFTGEGKKGSELKVTNDLRDVDALIMVIDAFSPDADPEKYIQNLYDEMMLADQVVVENNLANKTKKMTLTGDKTIQTELDLLQKCLDLLEDDKALLHLESNDVEARFLRNYQFLSHKPILIMLNIAEEDLPKQNEIYNQYKHVIEPGKRELATLCGKLQMDLATLPPEEQQAFFEDMGVTSSAMDKVIHKSYALLGLISFLTTGKPDVRAWTITKGTIAHRAAGAIHTDIERGFIRAEVTPFDDYVAYKTPAALKAAGKTRLEGKDYIVQDGDVILFRFNV
ncbi:MAG: YchF family ATPase [candidate division Zixibacteria bacterium]|nr:YchF family ATPase [candidate division Zixibacteria bacterium]MDH3936961.1 YchF family ATPase [candidate division Zixibacteria bacterium]MDH4034495.1 YchF family ATPase [candidate division Zixibacteria bacterium]